MSESDECFLLMAIFILVSNLILLFEAETIEDAQISILLIMIGIGGIFFHGGELNG